MPRSMKLMIKAAILTHLLSSASGSWAYASDFTAKGQKGAFGLSLNYPGIGMRYFLNDQFVLEVKGQAEGGTAAGGFRAYKYFAAVERMFLFLGIEGDYIQFKGKISRGSGAAAEFFGGLEYFVSPSISLQADFGPVYIYLKNRHEPVSVGGLEYVANFGLNLYWGGGKAGRTGHKESSRNWSRDQEDDPGGPWLRY